MVCEHEEFILTIFKVVLLSFEYFNNCQQFTVVSLILITSARSGASIVTLTGTYWTIFISRSIMTNIES